MFTSSIIIQKASVYEEVAKTTAYTGAKMKDDESAYNRIFATDADREMLERFWNEACSNTTEELKRFINPAELNSNANVSHLSDEHGVDLTDDYKVILELSDSFDANLLNSMQASIFSYFVNSICAKWFKFTNRGDSESYSTDADKNMLDMRAKLFYRKKPKRIPITKD